MNRNNIILKKVFSCTMFAILLITSNGVSQNEQPSANPEMSDLDEFMAKVMQKRWADAENLREYVFNEREALDVEIDSKIASQWSYRREYLWFVRDDYLVRSPVVIDGVKVSDKEKSTAEDEWINGQKKRGKSTNKNGIDYQALFGLENANSLDFQAFFGFEFEPGRYLYGGERQFEGRKALLVEYYPKLSDGKKGSNNKKDSINGLFEKSYLVTMLISPDDHQILQITFDNVGLEFLPARWLVRMNDIKASMVMDKTQVGIWLPRKISAYGSISTAGADLSINYTREFYEYAKSHVDVKLWFDTDEVELEHEE